MSLVATQGSWRRVATEGGPEHRAALWQVPPRRRSATITYFGHGMFLRFGVEIAFHDASGQDWRRLADGTLERIGTNPVDFRPVTWEDNTVDAASPD